MKRFMIALGLAAVVASSASANFPDTNAESGIALHITPWEQALPGLCAGPGVEGNTVLIEWPLAGDPINDDWFVVYVLVCGASDSLGVAGLEYGIDYDGNSESGVDITGWASCTDLEFPMNLWPAAGTGNLQTWDRLFNCQNESSNPYVPRTVIATAGFFEVQVWGADQLTVTPRPVTGRAKVGDCFGAEWDITDYYPTHLGVAGFSLPGWNPCVSPPDPVRSATWGEIKQSYR